MRCPSCGSEVADDAASCPACGAELDATRVLRLPPTRWCPLCGALVRADDEVCPSCGAPLPARRRAAAPAGEMSGGTGAAGAGRARHGAGPSHASAAPADSVAPAEVAPRFDGAAGAAGEGGEPFRPRPLVVALACALVVTGGTVLAIAHPWDPGTRARHVQTMTPSTSDVRQVRTLSGQDETGSSAARLGRRGARSTYEWASDAYALVGELGRRVGDNHDALVRAAQTADAATGLDDGSDEARRLVRELDQLEDDLAGEDVDDAYASDVGHLRALVGWLSTCARGLSGGWDALSASEPGDRSEVAASALEEAGFDASWDSYEGHLDAYAPRDLG